MTTPTFAWEHRLLALAHAPIKDDRDHAPVAVEQGALKLAYKTCASITARHSKTFHLASSLLPASKRSAIRALYAFCRVTDDLVDAAECDPRSLLEEWRTRALGEHPSTGDPVALAWADARARYQVPSQYAHQLMDGVSRDFVATRYDSFDQLAEYAYGVASTVGLMAMHIIGFQGPEAIPYAIKLGVALQMTNILRDVAEDWHKGRLYLPQKELSRFGLCEADIAAGRTDHRWQAFMRFQIERNRRLYEEAMPGISMLHADGRFAIAAAADLYQAILEDIEDHDADVFSRRAYISGLGKLRRLPGIWWRARRARLT